jgi:DnaJ-domain-containing protein 1
MPGSALGSRLPFEVPEVAFSEGSDDRDPIRAAFAELGVPVTASIEEVTRAYRQRVKEVHPDQGGDEAEFKRVREAYTTAKEHADGVRAGAAD